MEHKQINLIRIHFYRSLPQLEQNFNKRIYEVCTIHEKNKILKLKDNNIANYLFLTNLKFKRYKNSLKQFYSSIEKIEENDCTNIILLFFPEFLKSKGLENEISLNDKKFCFKNFRIRRENCDYLEKEIKIFFDSYNNLRQKFGFSFSNEEMFIYLDFFLNKYSSREYEGDEGEKIENLLCLNYFLCFIRPEIFYKIKI